MAVYCSQCREELLGAVNRCWRCGAAFVPQAGSGQAPPVRINPPPAEVQSRPETPQAPWQPASQAGPQPASQVVLQPAPVSPSDQAPPLTAILAGQADLPALEAIVQPDGRRGSPFADNSILTAPSVSERPVQRWGATPSYVPPAPAAYQPRHAAAVAGVFASLMLGALSLVVGWFTGWAVVTAALGVAMGVWGLFSNRRWLAVAAIALCCLALATMGVRQAILIYVNSQSGSAPPDEDELPLEAFE